MFISAILLLLMAHTFPKSQIFCTKSMYHPYHFRKSFKMLHNTCFSFHCNIKLFLNDTPNIVTDNLTHRQLCLYKTLAWTAVHCAVHNQKQHAMLNTYLVDVYDTKYELKIINLLKPSGYFYVPCLKLKKFCMLVTLHLYILCGSQSKQQPFALYIINL